MLCHNSRMVCNNEWKLDLCTPSNLGSRMQKSEIVYKNAWNWFRTLFHCSCFLSYIKKKIRSSDFRIFTKAVGTYTHTHVILKWTKELNNNNYQLASMDIDFKTGSVFVFKQLFMFKRKTRITWFIQRGNSVTSSFTSDKTIQHTGIYQIVNLKFAHYY